MNISTATLEWIDTKLTYASIVARGSPYIIIICFKHNENKLYHLYTMNTCPELDNPESLESNPGQTYTMLPSETKLSLDFEFMSITTFGGAVKVVKLPPVLDPLQNEKIQMNTDTQSKVSPSPELSASNTNANSATDLQAVTISGEIEGTEHQDLDLKSILIASLNPKEEDNFQDPYIYKPEERSVDSVTDQHPPATQEDDKDQDKKAEQKFLLGKYHLKDEKGGDAGSLLKTNKFYPCVDFVRSQFCGRYQNSIQHQDVPPSGTAKQMKAYFVTTGFLVAYQNTFEVSIYTIQKPTKEATPQDYTSEYFSKVVVQRRLNVKKNKEKTLAMLVKQIQNQGEPTQQEIITKQQQKQKEVSEARIKDMRQVLESQITSNTPSRQFRMPYHITCCKF